MDTSSLKDVVYAAQKISVSQDAVAETIEIWSNISNFTGSQLLAYAEKYYEAQYSQYMWNAAINISLFPLAILGLVGYLLETIVLRHPEFNTPSFLYHKTLVGLESILLVCCICKMSIDYVLIPTTMTTLQCVSYILNSLQNICGMTAEFLALMVCIERMVALFLPTKFHEVNTKKVAALAIFVCFIFGIHYAIDAFRSILSKDQIYLKFRLYRDNLEMAEGFILAILSCFLAVGVVLQQNKRARLKKSDKEARAAASISLQLSLLCVSLAIPIFLDTLMWQICEMMCENRGCVMGAEAVKLSYATAVSQLNMATASVILNFWADFLWGIAHSDHFYVYLLLSRRFQRAAVNILISGKSRVVPVTTQISMSRAQEKENCD